MTESSAVLSLPALSRLLANVLPGSHALDGEGPIDLTSQASAPRLISATILEDRELRAHRVEGQPVVGFAAFLDGTQDTRVLAHTPGGIPLIVGSVGAVIRDRRNQRMHTWRHIAERRIYAPRAFLPADLWQRLAMLPLAIVDTSDAERGDAADSGEREISEHPLALRDAAIHRVQRDREAAERALADDWCRREERLVLIDGGISGAESVARAACVVGVVKSHRTLYARGDALATVLALGAGQRSSVFLVTSRKRTSVASWYLRIRDPRGHDPMWGLVRVEVSAPGADAAAHDIGARADLASRWILAEASPASLPDPRWDKMVYGVRDCEEFLRATR